MKKYNIIKLLAFLCFAQVVDLQASSFSSMASNIVSGYLTTIGDNKINSLLTAATVGNFAYGQYLHKYLFPKKELSFSEKERYRSIGFLEKILSGEAGEVCPRIAAITLLLSFFSKREPAAQKVFQFATLAFNGLAFYDNKSYIPRKQLTMNELVKDHLRKDDSIFNFERLDNADLESCLKTVEDKNKALIDFALIDRGCNKKLIRKLLHKIDLGYIDNLDLESNIKLLYKSIEVYSYPIAQKIVENFLTPEPVHEIVLHAMQHKPDYSDFSEILVVGLVPSEQQGAEAKAAYLRFMTSLITSCSPDDLDAIKGMRPLDGNLLHRAIRNNQSNDILQLIIQTFPALVHDENRARIKPFFYMLEHCPYNMDLSTVDMFLNAGASLQDVNDQGLSPFMLACRQSSLGDNAAWLMKSLLTRQYYDINKEVSYKGLGWVGACNAPETKSFLQYCLDVDCPDILRLILTDKEILIDRDDDGKPTLDLNFMFYQATEETNAEGRQSNHAENRIEQEIGRYFLKSKYAGYDKQAYSGMSHEIYTIFKRCIDDCKEQLERYMK